ncbi:MAG TPA: hypothetical protein VFQ54_09900 [Thermomicrobiales bacterium]|nr:hypothetical protein [Thermomicrobiales bacterium]
MTESWSTLEEVHAARARFEEAILGWRRPEAFGVCIVTQTASSGIDVNLPVVTVRTHYLAAAILAGVVGHVSGDEALPLSVEQLSQAIELLAPASAYPKSDHPNIAAWRRLHREASASTTLLAVFLDELRPEIDPKIALLRVAVNRWPAPIRRLTSESPARFR